MSAVFYAVIAAIAAGVYSYFQRLEQIPVDFTHSLHA
jgi:hypothetical protein